MIRGNHLRPSYLLDIYVIVMVPASNLHDSTIGDSVNYQHN